MRFSLIFVLGTLLFHSAVAPLALIEDCPIQELRHTDDDCSPLCVTCGCSPVGHAFQAEKVLESAIGGNSALTFAVPPSIGPDVPPREILHVPLLAPAL